ncbi:MAG TPA: nickel pincer cofactor biosynthesis protein LarC, partial [Pyrinomonadaceae bacterium]|nr:nickel pincer cofactor biosynthesis protein LarC [Pyrinomonadaceae bacterium]
MKTLYFDCFAGASGNMILGALISAGLDQDFLFDELKKLHISDFKLETKKVDRSGINALHVNVITDDQKNHRHLSEIVKLIEASGIQDKAKSIAIKIFRRLGEAEAAVHGIDVEKIHFHEVGAMDAIIDIVGSAIGFTELGIERFYNSPINVGSGFIEAAHGILPVPPPAVANLLIGNKIYSYGPESELTTPTGAAIISTLSTSCIKLPKISPEVVAFGAGSRSFDGFPNVLRIIIGTTDRADSKLESQYKLETLKLIETNLDNTTGEQLAYFQERAFEAGALDCWVTPIHMKKSRPAFLLSVLCKAEIVDQISELLFRETPTLGFRIKTVERASLEREFRKVEYNGNSITIKEAFLGNGAAKSSVEFEDAKKAAVATGKALREIQAELARK